MYLPARLVLCDIASQRRMGDGGCSAVQCRCLYGMYSMDGCNSVCTCVAEIRYCRCWACARARAWARARALPRGFFSKTQDITLRMCYVERGGERGGGRLSQLFQFNQSTNQSVSQSGQSGQSVSQANDQSSQHKTNQIKSMAAVGLSRRESLIINVIN